MNSAIVVSIFFAVFCTVFDVTLAWPNHLGTGTVQQSANDHVSIAGIGNQYSSLIDADVNANAQGSLLDGLLSPGVPVPVPAIGGLGGLGGLPGLGGLGGLPGLGGLGELVGLGPILGRGATTQGLLDSIPTLGPLANDLPLVGTIVG